MNILKFYTLVTSDTGAEFGEGWRAEKLEIRKNTKKKKKVIK